MRQNILFISLLAMIFCGVVGAVAQGRDDIDSHRKCAHCGMDRKAYGYSRMLVEYVDGGQVGLCSLHCAVTELDANKGRAVKALLVADRDSRTLLAVKKAVWVIGGKKRGVMTQQPKWAFATAAAARAFVKANGGTVVSWDEALKAAREEVPDHVETGVR